MEVDDSSSQPPYDSRRRATLISLTSLSLQDSVVNFYDDVGDGTLLFACESANGSDNMVLSTANGLKDADELSVLFGQKCMLPVSFSETVNQSGTTSSTAVLELPVAMEIAAERTPAGEHVAVSLDCCKARLEIPLEMKGPFPGECMTLNFENCNAILEFPVDMRSGVSAECVAEADTKKCQRFVGVPFEVPVSLSGHHTGESMMASDFESCRAEPETLRGMTWLEGNIVDPDVPIVRGMGWLSEAQLEDMVRERRQERPSEVRTKKNSAKLSKKIRLHMDQDNESTDGANEDHAIVKLNTSMNRLVKYTILNTEELPSVVLDYPPPREPKRISWREESLVYDSEYPTISVTSNDTPMMPVPPRPILKRAEKQFPFSDESETATPIVLTRKRMKRHKRHSFD